jgi:murein DD-endopeptidase MepM/ murein hydrolase activator NlpD
VQLQLEQSLSENTQEQSGINGRISLAQYQIATLDDKISSLTDEIAATQDAIDRDRAEAALMARALYFTPESMLFSLLTAGSLNEVITTASDNLVAGARARAVEDRLNTELKRLADEKAAATADRLEKQKIEEGLQAHLKRLIELQASQEDLAVRVADQLDQLRGTAGGLNLQNPDLSQQILATLDAQQEAILAAASQQIWSQVQVWVETAGLKAPQPPPTSTHSHTRLIWPEPGAVISQGFGPSSLVLEPPFGGYPHFHTGIDLAAPEMTPVLAADDGTVAVVGSGNYGYGNYVVIAHRDGMLSLYGHLHQSVVKGGDQVAQGQQIGYEGSTGNSTGPHVHFEVRINGQPVDPALYLPPGP